jgi:hypothetical protein
MRNRPYYPNLIIVGGTGRNSGKTSFLCKLIEKYQGVLPFTGLKVSAIYPNEKELHGSHPISPKHGIQIFRETNAVSEKDTSRMLQAGAREVWFVSAKDDKLEEALHKILKMVGKETILICESNSLVEFIQPGLFVMIKRIEHTPFKPRVLELEKYVDLVVNYEDGPFDSSVERINFSSHGWFLSE